MGNLLSLVHPKGFSSEATADWPRNVEHFGS